MVEKPVIGFIGLGLMGKAMARNILRAGYPLVVHNRSQAPVEALVAEGARPAGTPAEVAAQVEIVFSSLPDSPDVELVALGEKGIIQGAHPGLIYVDHSTIKPATARRVSRRSPPLDAASFASSAPRVAGSGHGSRSARSAPTSSRSPPGAAPPVHGNGG